MSKVVTLPKRKTVSKPPPRVIRESVALEERRAAEELARKASALQRLLNTTWATPMSLAKAPGLIDEAQAALDELRGLLSDG